MFSQMSSVPSAGGGRLSCEECGGEDFDDGDDGFYYCRLCGSQSQDLLHTATNAEDVGAPADGAVYNLFRRRAHNAPSTPVPNLPSGEDLLRVLSQQPTSTLDALRTCSFKTEKEEPSDPRDFGDAAEQSKDPEAVGCSIRLRYVQGLQLMLQWQCDTLVQRFNVSNSIRRIAALVWMRHLIRSGFLEGNWIRSVLSANGLYVEKKEIVRLVKGKLKVKVVNLNKKRASRIWLYSLRKAMPIYTTLAISFLACHLAKEAILPTDITEWALDGKLPYLAAFVEIDRDLGYSWINHLLNSRSLFRPVRTIGAWQLEATAASIARHVGLRLPPVNFNAIASRYLKELHLPVDKIFPSACKLYEWSMPAELWLSSNMYRFPTRICVMAILVVIIRILYNIHGQGTWERIVSGLSKCATQGPVDAKSDCDNLGSVHESWKGLDDSQQLGFTPGLSSQENLSETQTTDFNAEELLAELEAGYSKICTNPDHLKDLRSYLKYCGDTIFAGLTSTSTERNMIERLWEIYDNQEDEEPVYDLKEGLVNLGKRSRDELPSFLDGNGCDDCTDHVMGDPLVPEILGDDKGDAIQKMKLSMEGNGFRYLPPRGRQKTNDYLHYRRQLADGKLIFVAHADYYVLLCSCAKAGVDLVADLLGVTLGPKERNVVLGNKYGPPKIVNDGETVLKEIELEDPLENLGVKLVRQAGAKTNDLAGDGSTTSIVLARGLIAEGVKVLSVGMNPVQIARGIEKTAKALVSKLKLMSREIEDHEIAHVAAVSAGNDHTIGNMIADALRKVGRKGAVRIEQGRSLGSSLEILEGMPLDRGYLSPYFVTDRANMFAEFIDCKILLVDKKIADPKAMFKVLDGAVKEKYPLLVIAEGVEQEVLALMIRNKLKGAFKVAAIKAPSFGEGKSHFLDDLAILTRGKVVRDEMGLTLEKAGKEVLGSAAKVVVTNNSTLIVTDGSTKHAVEKRVHQIRSLAESTEEKFKKEILNERIARLCGGIAVIQVGAQTEVELQDKKLRIEDAINATKAAIEEGVVVGGGCTLLRLSTKVDSIKASLDNDEQKIGADIFKHALSYPSKLIVKNAGMNGSVIVGKILSIEDLRYGYNAAKNRYEDLIAAGILDPTKVVRCCLENAASVAKTFLTSDVVEMNQPKPIHTK